MYEILACFIILSILFHIINIFYTGNRSYCSYVGSQFLLLFNIFGKKLACVIETSVTHRLYCYN